MSIRLFKLTTNGTVCCENNLRHIKNPSKPGGRYYHIYGANTVQKTNVTKKLMFNEISCVMQASLNPCQLFPLLEAVPAKIMAPIEIKKLQ